MASVQWNGGKCKSIQQVKAWLRHNSVEERLEANHSNTDIDKDLTHLNFSYRGLTYAERCAALDKRLSEIDMGRPGSGKNARTIYQSMIVYAPEALRGDHGRLRDWFSCVGDIAVEMFGDENVIDMMVDMDEVHEYIDPETKEKRLSSEHGHLGVVPVIDGKLNGDKFAKIGRIKAFNNAIHKMTVMEFGCSFNDGTKKKGREPVEVLKAKSLRAEVELLEEQADTLITDALDDATEIRMDAQRDARATRQEADQDRAEAKRLRNTAYWDAQEAEAMKDEADEYARTTRKKADDDAQDARAAADRDAEATRQAAERDAARIRREATAAAQVAQGQAAAARLERDEAKKEAIEYARKAQQLKQARDGLQTALQGDLRTFQAQEARRGAAALLDALGATVRPLVVPRLETAVAIRDGLKAAPHDTDAKGAWNRLQAIVARDEAQAETRPAAVELPTV